jgi:hypothetical protein
MNMRGLETDLVVIVGVTLLVLIFVLPLLAVRP